MRRAGDDRVVVLSEGHTVAVVLRPGKVGYEDVEFYFFFQAEDGIRDIGVTGVQTCALPICPDVLAIMLGQPTVRGAEPGHQVQPEPAARVVTPDSRRGRPVRGRVADI